jgi:PTS system cellobiose-specific IIC component
MYLAACGTRRFASNLITGGDWRAAVWGLISILIAMSVYYPFAKVAERQRLAAEAAVTASE